MRVIKNIESTSIGNTRIKNDDGIFIGENFAAVFDGVSTKSAIVKDGKKIRIADIIIEAMKTIDSKNAPTFAKELTLNEFLQIINMYIKKYCHENSISLKDYKLESTGAIYSKYHNQIWLVGDCRAVYDGKTVENELKVDDLYTEMRMEVLKALFREGYAKEDIFREDISHIIIKNPQKCSEYIKDKSEAERIKKYIEEKMYYALLEAGFTAEQIQSESLLKRFYNPIVFQEYVKNNPNAKTYGYSVFNGINTPVQNCKVVDLPDSVKTIRLSTDGFPLDVLKKSKDLGAAIRKNRYLSQLDPIGINPPSIHNCAIQDREGHLAFDDESAIEIRIEEKNIEDISR